MSTSDCSAKDMLNIIIDVVAEHFDCDSKKRAIIGSPHMHGAIADIVEAFLKNETCFFFDWEAVGDVLRNALGPKYKSKSKRRTSSVYGPVTRARIAAVIFSASAQRASASFESLSSRQKRSKKAKEKLEESKRVREGLFAETVRMVPSLLKIHQSDLEVIESVLGALAWVCPCGGGVSGSELAKFIKHLRECFKTQLTSEGALLPIERFLRLLDASEYDDDEKAGDALALMKGEILAEAKKHLEGIAESSVGGKDEVFSAIACVRRLRVLHQGNDASVTEAFISTVYDAVVAADEDEDDLLRELVLLLHAFACSSIDSGTHLALEKLAACGFLRLPRGEPRAPSAPGAARTLRGVRCRLTAALVNEDYFSMPSAQTQRRAASRLQACMSAFEASVLSIGDCPEKEALMAAREGNVLREFLIPYGQSCLAAADSLDGSAMSVMYRYYTYSTTAQISDIVKRFHREIFARAPEQCLHAQFLALASMYDEAVDEDAYFAVGTLADALGKSFAASMTFGANKEHLKDAFVDFASDGIKFAFTFNDTKESTRIGFMDSVASYVRLFAKRAKAEHLIKMKKAIDVGSEDLRKSNLNCYEEMIAAGRQRDPDSIWESLYEFEELLQKGEKKKERGKANKAVRYKPLEMAVAKASTSKLRRLDEDEDDEDDEDVHRNVLEDPALEDEDEMEEISISGDAYCLLHMY